MLDKFFGTARSPVGGSLIWWVLRGSGLGFSHEAEGLGFVVQGLGAGFSVYGSFRSLKPEFPGHVRV